MRVRPLPFLRRALRALAVIAWPAACPACGGPLPAAAIRGICPLCWASLPAILPPACPTCALVLPGGTPCPDCAGRAPGSLPDGAAAAFLYAGRMVRIHRLFKFQGDVRLAAPLAERMARAHMLAGLPLPDAVAPVPPDPARSRARGHVPRLLARRVARHLGSPFDGDLLAKVRPTPSQASAPDRAARETALVGAFVARGGNVRGRSILVVDDVSTTGATLREAVRSLREAGALLVTTLVLARTPPRGTFSRAPAEAATPRRRGYDAPGPSGPRRSFR